MTTNTFEVILTHEHTDFDALASMLAASLLFPGAYPVLPRQLNRNVRDFLTLYKNHFPFVTDKDLPRGVVSRAILVDARSVNWVKGMDSDTPLLLIDHHGAFTAAGLEQIWGAPVGANTTLLVEKLIEKDFALSPVQATLLTLGIHEDTGSLTYSSTTHRDARCLAWLLETQHKVNLEVVSHFLNHPLSEPQRQLLQILIDHSEFLEIAGHTLVIAQAKAHGFKEELSALASRMRDFHETDAIFLIVDLGDIVQVVGRSMTDEIDVGKVASLLGGGGHARAAAAPLHGQNMTTQAVRDRIISLVREYSRSAITVHHIMSMGRPQTLSPNLTMDQAAELMRRYGHEGFPVVRQTPEGGEELLGVLTRREADRALNHGLGDQPVTRFMRAGQVTVHPDDPVTVLRRLMIESNWGQIPVVDANNQIIGIVTRTDLIKLWDESSLPRHHADEIARRLQALLPPIQLALLHMIGKEVAGMDYAVYVVGGFVRDLLLNHRMLNVAALDMDIVIEGNAIEFARRLHQLYGGRVVPHKRFNTAKWLLDDTGQPVDRVKLLADLAAQDDRALPPHLDFVTARTEFYTAPTVLPTVEDSSIKLDLHRRDFTINTLAVCLNPERWGELLDFYGGVKDLNAGMIRVLHSLSFVDDPTRILRAVRYEQRFAFEIESRTLELLEDAVELIERVTPARIRHELERILQEDAPEKALARLDQLHVLARLYPELRMDSWGRQKFALLRLVYGLTPGDPVLQAAPLERLYWGILVYRLSPLAQSQLAMRLSLRAETQRLVNALAKLRAHHSQLAQAGLSPSAAVEILDNVEPSALALAQIIHADDAQLLTMLSRYRSKWQFIRPELDGHDLTEMGLPHGPGFHRVLAALRAARLDGHVATCEAEKALARKLVAVERANPNSLG